MFLDYHTDTEERRGEQIMAATRYSSFLQTVLILLALIFPKSAAQAKYGGGSGTADDPYQIWTAEQMNAIGAEPNDWGKHFKLMADIDLSAYDGQEGRPAFNVIARGGNPPKTSFTGTFDGGGHTVSHFVCHSTYGAHIGLFGEIAGPSAQVRNLGLTDLLLDPGGGSTGGLAGYSAGRVVGCRASGVVIGVFNVGGLVGINRGTVTECHYAGTVRGWSAVGGLVGDNGTAAGSVRHCYSGGAVTVGSGPGGGLIGYSTGEVIGCYSTAAVNGEGGIGGLVGHNDAEGLVICCYSTGPVHGDLGSTGGLVGGNRDTVIHSYSTGPVSGPAKYAGGLVGSLGYGTGRESVVSDSFWDMSISGQAESNGGTGRTTAEMQDIRTYLQAGWDFVGESENGTCEVWQMPAAGGCPVQSTWSGYVPPRLQGSGTAEDPYLVSDARELGAIFHYPWEAHYRLAASIDLAGIRWAMAVIPRFQGTFDGHGLTVAHLTITGVSYLGMFGRLESEAAVRDLGVVDVNIGGGRYVGALVGDNAGTITGCHSRGTVGEGGIVGGVAGRNSGTMTDCHNEAIVSSSFLVGGLLGMNMEGRVARCGNTGVVQWRDNQNGEVWVGGLIGDNHATVTQCCNRGTVSGGDHRTAKYPGIYYTGGLVGGNGGDVTNCYSTGGVSGSGQDMGGLAGLNGGTLTCCYSAGIVNNPGQLSGGLVGYGRGIGRSGAGPTGEAVRCFWDTQVSGRNLSAGGTGKTTSEMWTAKTFLDAGWDFIDETSNGTEDVWGISEGQDYPRLSWERDSKP
jgi:hypothetical protein